MAKKKLNRDFNDMSMDKLNYILISAFLLTFLKLTSLMCSKEQLKITATE